MPEITVSDDQREYLDALREALAAEHVGDYGHVRARDAIQYLIDAHGPPDDLASAPAADEDEADAEEDVAGDENAEDDDESGDGPEDRLSAMMSLLDDHDDKWREVDSEEGRYEVDLPDDGTAVVRTKDDVRAALFEHYG